MTEKVCDEKETLQIVIKWILKKLKQQFEFSKYNIISDKFLATSLKLKD